MTDSIPTEGAAGAQASEGSTASAPPESDFVRRAQENPQWASDQVRQFQSAADRAEAERMRLVEQIAPMKSLIDTYGSQTIAAAVENYRAIRNSSEIGEMIQEYERTGQLPTRKGSESKMEEDEYKTPEEREIEALKSQLAKVAQDTSANTLASGRQVLQGHMERVFGEYGFTPEDTEKMRSSMNAQFDAWSSMGDVGINAMKSLMSKSGDKTVRGIMLSAIEPEALRAAAANTNLRKREGLSGLSTGGPSGVLSTGMETPPIFKTAKEAADYARANPEGHDSY